MNATLKNIVTIIIIGLLGWFGIFVVVPVLFTAAIYVIGFIAIVLIIVGLYTWIKEFLEDIDIESTTSNKSKAKDNSSLYRREKDEEEIYTVLTYIEALPSIELNEVNENDKLYLAIEKENKYGKDAIAVYSRYWYKIGYCNENLSKTLTKLINKGINYIGIVVEVNKHGNDNLELKVRIAKTLYNPIENHDSEDLNSTFITTVVGVTFGNRQEIISEMKKGDKLSLVREMDNNYDNNAIAIYNLKNTQIGYCNKQLSKLLTPLMDSGTIYEAEVVRIKGGGDLNFGMDIKVIKCNLLDYSSIVSEEKDPDVNNIDMLFLSYVKSLSTTELMSIVNSVYNDMKGTSNLVPYMGEFGSIEFAETMLMWEYAKTNKDKEYELYNNFFILLADSIGCAFNHMSAGEWSDRIDTIIMKFPQIMSLSELGQTYIYLKENYFEQIRLCEFNILPDDMFNNGYNQVYIKYMERYNNMLDFNQVFNYFSEQGLGITRLLYEVTKNKVDEWNVVEVNIFSDVTNDYNPYLIDNFYNSSYICPNCKSKLDKTVFRPGEEYQIKTNVGNIHLKRVFTCRRCLSFFGPIPGYKLNEGEVFTIKYESSNLYNKTLSDMSLKGTTDGRVDI